MMLGDAATYQPDRFNIVRNTQTLIKLALLDPGQVQRLFGLPAEKDIEPVTIMATFARSIDGDYQWMMKSPRYARSSGEHEVPVHSYGYGQGFRFFNHSKGAPMFRRIFRGPIAPGYLDGQFAAAVPVSYTFRPTQACAFPESERLTCR